MEISDTQDERQKLIYSSHLRGFHWLILGLSAILTSAAWYITTEQVNERAAERFERESLQVIELVKERMQLYEHALWGAVAHLDADQTLPYTQYMKSMNCGLLPILNRHYLTNKQ